MVKNPEILEIFELEYEQNTNNTYQQRLLIFESMMEFRNTVLKERDPLEGLEEKIEIIKRLHRAKPYVNEKPEKL